MNANTLRDEFETRVRIEPVARRYDGKGTPIGAERWQWLQSTEYVTKWHDGFESREAAFVDAVHTLLAYAQRHGHDEQYGRLMLLAWTLPCPLKFLQEWDTDFRPRAKAASPQIPDACRAPKQALAWGMDPVLVQTAPARREIADWTSGYERYPSDRARALRSKHGSYGAWLYRAQVGRLDGDNYSLTSDLSRVCNMIRRAGLAEAFGVWTEPATADTASDTAAC